MCHMQYLAFLFGFGVEEILINAAEHTLANKSEMKQWIWMEQGPQ